MKFLRWLNQLTVNKEYDRVLLVIYQIKLVAKWRIRRMKKVIALVLSTVLCLGIFAGCGNSKSGSSSAASTVASTAATSSAEKKTFTVGFDQDFYFLFSTFWF